MYILRLKSDSSRVDGIKANNIEEAKEFFIARKKMDEETFDKLYYIEQDLNH